MTQEHPITPPPELVQKWINEEQGVFAEHIATQAARWGADQELEACLGEIRDGAGRVYIDEFKLRVCLADGIWTARRPKPPSLKEQALAIVENLGICDHLSPEDERILYQAIESQPS